VQFTEYVSKQIEPAIEDISSLSENSRKHIQKLIFTNVVNQFDIMIDNMILNNVRYYSIYNYLSSKMTKTITEQELINMLIDYENITNAIIERLKTAAKEAVLRQRHSLKLKFLLESLNLKDYITKRPMVQAGTGKVDKDVKQTKVKVPQSLLGYADWLYSRRNGIVHGSSSNVYLENDRQQLKKLYDFECPKRLQITIGSTKNAVTFYTNIVEIIQHQIHTI